MAVGIDDTDIDRRWVFRIVSGAFDYPERNSSWLSKPSVLSNPHPSINADQKAGPEGQDYQHQSSGAPFGRGAGHAIGDWISDQQRQRVDRVAMRRLDR